MPEPRPVTSSDSVAAAGPGQLVDPDAAPAPDQPQPPSLTRRGIRRARREAAGLRRVTVRAAGEGSVQVSLLPGGSEQYRLDQPTGPCYVSGVVTLLLAEPAALARLAASGLLTGGIRRLHVRLAIAPRWLVTGVHQPRPDVNLDTFSWRRHGSGLELEFRWRREHDVRRALAAAVAAVLRPRAWEQASGPLHVLDRGSWVDGTSTWPQGRTVEGPPEVELDGLGRPLGPYLVAARTAERSGTPIITAVANPFNRSLAGAATRYRLVADERRLLLLDEAGGTAACLDPAQGWEAGLLRGKVDKYAAVSLGERAPDLATAAPALRILAACGMVFATSDPAARAALAAHDLVVVADPAEVTDLAGYRLSVTASRRMAIRGDAALRRTALNGADTLPLPTVSVVLSSMRAEHIDTCLNYLAAQTYPALEVVVGLHGYDVAEETRERWRARATFPVRIVPFPAEVPFGEVLGRLSRAAEGDLLTKVDDDDHYGPDHITDLVIAAHASGADLVAKGARFVHLADRGQTIDRAWAAPEQFNVTPAGGTMLLSRGTLAQIGGWSHSSRHVDSDLLVRVRDAGGLVYRTHALEYVYVRRSTGHTFQTGMDRLLEQSERVYDGLPDEIVWPTGPRLG